MKCISCFFAALVAAAPASARIWSPIECRNVLTLFVVERSAQSDCLAEMPKADRLLFLQKFGVTCEQTDWPESESGLVHLRKAFAQIYDEACGS